MHHVLTDVQELTEWVTEAEEIVHEEISHISALPDPELPDVISDHCSLPHPPIPTQLV